MWSAVLTAARGAMFAGLSTLVVRLRRRGVRAALADALVAADGVAAGPPVAAVILRRRSHCRRLIPSASQGCSLENDPARYSARVTITITANAPSVTAMESGLGGRVKRIARSWPCGGARFQQLACRKCRKSMSQVPCRKCRSPMSQVSQVPYRKTDVASPFD